MFSKRIVGTSVVSIEVKGGIVFSVELPAQRSMTKEAFDLMIDCLVLGATKFDKRGAELDPFEDGPSVVRDVVSVRKKFLSAIRVTENQRKHLRQIQEYQEVFCTEFAELKGKAEVQEAWLANQARTIHKLSDQLEDAKAELVTMTAARDSYKHLCDQLQRSLDAARGH